MLPLSLKPLPSNALIVASHNLHKVEEIRDILGNLPVSIFSLLDLDWNVPHLEDGSNYYENALRKARAVIDHFGKPTLAEDSGLEVDALGGEPGLFSARYAGDRATDEDNNRKLLTALQDVPLLHRTGRYRCTVVFICPNTGIHSWEGTCEGLIASAPRGEKGFGYDPLFLISEYSKTFAELGDVVKNRISHRARALARFKKFFQESQNSC